MTKICAVCNEVVDDMFELFEKDSIKGHIYCLVESDRLTECSVCGRILLKEEAEEVEVYDDPWQEKPEVITICNPDFPAKGYEYDTSCLSLLGSSAWSHWYYFHCEVCERLVVAHAPANGWHSYYRILYDGTQICLKCYEKILLEDGHSKEEFEHGQIPGMFFSWDNRELTDAGYKEVPGYKRYFVRSSEDARRFCEKALKLIDMGYKVVVAYERLAIGGLEGTVSLYYK